MAVAHTAGAGGGRKRRRRCRPRLPGAAFAGVLYATIVLLGVGAIPLRAAWAQTTPGPAPTPPASPPVPPAGAPSPPPDEPSFGEPTASPATPKPPAAALAEKPPPGVAAPAAGQPGRKRPLALASAAAEAPLPPQPPPLPPVPPTVKERARVKDLVNVQGVRDNHLVGYGLVTGLANTGDNLQSIFTIQSVLSFLNRLGVKVNLNPASIILYNVAAVTVTATLPAYAKKGSRIDVVVASMASARSLAGGTLLLTPLLGADGAIYAVAQGPLAVGGFDIMGESGSLFRRNHLTTGRVASGALVEREVKVDLGQQGSLRLALRNPDFTTAARIAAAMNQRLGGYHAVAEDMGSVRVVPPDAYKQNPVQLVAMLEGIEVAPDRRARVVLNERTGTVVMGDEVRIATVAVSHGNLTLQVSTTFQVSQPLPFSVGGRTVVVPKSDVAAQEAPGRLKVVSRGVSIGEVVRALNALGVQPRDLVSVLQAIRAAGALQADLEVL